MAVKIRLQRHGKKNFAFFHIVVADARAPRDGRFIEQLGSYNPNTNPATIILDGEKALKWLNVGAQPTLVARRILSYEGVLLRKHLDGGIAKGALTQEQADAKWNAWKAERDAKIAAKKAGLVKDAAEKAKVALEAEKKVNAERAEALAKKAEELAEAQRKAAEEAAAAKAAEEANGKMQAAMDVLAQRYSLKADDYDGIAAALNDDQKLYEEAAGEAGMDVKQFMRVQQLERENARYQRQQAELAQRRQMDQAYQRLMQEADGVKAQYPAFDLNAEMQDPDFVRLLRAQVPLKTIYEVRHQDEILGGAMQYTAQKVAAKVAAGVSANRGRPAENGAAASGASGARFDVEHSTKEQRMALIRRAANGERIEF